MKSQHHHVEEVSEHPCGVHFVGSVPLSSSSETFSTLTAALSPRLRRIPDGETRERQQWTFWQTAVFSPCPFVFRSVDLDYAPVRDGRSAAPPGPISLLDTRYDEAALSSYETFCDLRERSVIPAGVRFQVSLPTPIQVIATFTAPPYQAECERLYEQKLLQALRRIHDHIPAEDLAIQWDCCIEFGMLENQGKIFTPWFSPMKEGIIDRFARLSQAVDSGVELGFHFCYGDLAHRHFLEPKDMSVLVDMAGCVKKAVQRDVNWFHMPVPKDRTDAAYFEPLESLQLGETEIYLGLVHAGDEKGTKDRIEVARRYLPEFGVATECGLGRTPQEELRSILEISAAVSSPVR